MAFESFCEELHKSYPAVRLHLLNIMAAGFHSQVMEPILTDFTIACNEVKIDSSKQVVLSGLLGKTCPVGDEDLQQRTYPNGAREAEGVPSSLRDFSPMLIESSCQLIGFLINTFSDPKSGEAFVTDEFGEGAIAVSRLYEAKYVEMYASYKIVDNGSAALGQAFVYDDRGQVISAFREVWMAKMKLYVLQRLIDRRRKPEQSATS
jgi:hypothetical protein